MESSWIYALLGGGLIGLSATFHLLLNGRVTGVSGIFFGILKPKGLEFLWRFKFIIGLILGGIISTYFMEQPFINESGRSMTTIVIAGFLVGFGTKLGSGCTSGHGVCGLSRLSLRSLAATLAFMISGVLSVSLFKAFLGGS